MQRDWQGLEKKLAMGKTLKAAAIEAGIDFEEAEGYAKERLKKSILDDAGLLESASKALQIGLSRLAEIAQEGPMVRSVTETSGSQEHGNFEQTSRSFEATHLEAAKALVKYAVDVRKIVGQRSGSGAKTSYPDLFDVQKPEDAEVIQGPWRLRKVE